MAKKTSANGTASTVVPFPGATPPAPPPSAVATEAPPPPAEAPEASFRRFVNGLNGPRLNALCEQMPALKVALATAWNDHEKQRDAFKARMAALKGEALALGIEFDAPRKARASTPRARPANGAATAPTADPAAMAKVLADLQTNGASKAVDSQARTGLDKALWGAAKAALVGEGKLTKSGTRGPQVTYAAAP